MPFFFDHYPYTNFHNVNLDWVLQAVKAWGQTVEANDRAFQDLKEANEDFKAYVTNYLQDLDITDEINTKLDAMLASGVLTPYFAPYVQGYVNSWLNSHVTPTSPALDNTLTLSGAAARADSTGSRLKDLAYIDALSSPEVYAAINRSLVMPGYRVQGVTYDYNGHFYVCGGSVDEDGTGVIVKMSGLDFKDAEMTVIQQLGHANDITYYDGYLYVCTVGGGDAPQWGIYKINVNDFTDKTLISNAPENTIGITYRQGDFWLLAPYRIYRTTDFTSYEVIVDNTNNLMTAYGIPTSGRISQTIFRTAGYLIGWVCSFVFEERHYGAITFFSSTGQPVAFKMFPAYHSELQGAVYADMSIWLLADGNLVNVFRMDPRNLSYIQLKAGDDLNDFTGRGTLYSTGSNVSSELVNSPSAGEGFTVQVERLGVYNTIQTARTNSGRELYRVKSFSAGTWGEWIEPAAEVGQIKEDLSAVEEVVYIRRTVDLSTAELLKGLIAASNGFWNTGEQWRSYIIPVPHSARSMVVTSEATNGSVIAILANRTLVKGVAPTYATGCKREWVPGGNTKTFAVPDDAEYIVILKYTQGNDAIIDYTPQELTFLVDGINTTNLSTITHEPIESPGVLAVVRRCRQLTDIKWTPAVDIPRICQLTGYGRVNSQYYEDVFKAGVEYTGIPYGQATKNAEEWGKPTTTAFKVGLGVGLDTFISAIQSPESVVAKESEYTWSGSVHLASFYATICSALCCYAYDLPVYYTTDKVDDADGMVKLDTVSAVGVDNIKIGDMLHTNAHAVVITDFIRDANGNISAVEISEETTIGNADWNVSGSQYGGLCRREFVSREELLRVWGAYTVCRYSYIDDVTYTASPYVNTGDEPLMRRINNFPVLPYMGENFVYVAGAIANTKILTPAYRADSLNKLRVKKDGANWNTDGTTNYYDVTGAFVEVGFTEVGNYEAYLCQVSGSNETMTTRACHWTVIDA